MMLMSDELKCANRPRKNGEALTYVKNVLDNLGDIIGGKNICVLAFAMPPRGSHIDRTRGLLTIDPRPRLADVKKRFAERDQRQATDTRNAAEKWLGDPPPDRSALAQRKQPTSSPVGLSDTLYRGKAASRAALHCGETTRLADLRHPRILL
jgi:hypothetical protein